jgi:predicted Zn-dependent peptidase
MYETKLLFTPGHNLLNHIKTSSDDKTFEINLAFLGGCKAGPPGLAHLFEHCVFLGTTTRTRDEIERGLMKVGGGYNAFTSEDGISFICSGLEGSISKGMEILTDIAFNCTLDRNIEEEKLVVLAETAPSFNKKKQSIDVGDMGNLLLFGEEASNILGTEEKVAAYTSDDLLLFKDRNMTKDRCFVSVVSPFDTNIVSDIVDSFLKDQSDTIFRPEALVVPANKGIFGVFAQDSDAGSFTVEIQIALNNRPWTLYSTLQKFVCSALCDGEISCLFGAARQRGLVYFLGATIQDIVGNSVLNIGFETTADLNKVEQTVDLIVESLHRVAEEGVPEEDFELFKNSYLFGLYRAYQDPHQAASSSIDALFMDVITPSSQEKIQAIQALDVNTFKILLTDMLKSESKAIAVVGPAPERVMKSKMKCLKEKLKTL